MDLYFKRHDGQAVTCDDFRAAMADANGRDLASFAAWCACCGFTHTPFAELGCCVPKSTYLLGKYCTY